MTQGNLREELLEKPPKVINVGLRQFGETLLQQGLSYVHWEWKPSPILDKDVSDALGKML